MAEYNPSKIIKDGNTYNFRDTTKIPLAGSNAISGDLIPSTDGTVNLGGSSYQWNNAYIKSLTINGVACGDILTHNASEFVDVSGDQTIDGNKEFTSSISVKYYLKATKYINFNDNSSIYISGGSGWNSGGQILINGKNNTTIGNEGNITADGGGMELRCVTNLNGIFSIYFNNNNSIKEPQFSPSHNTINLGTSTNKWKSFNGINPGALSLPGTYVNVDTTNWVLDGSNVNIFTPTSDGWLGIQAIDTVYDQMHYVFVGRNDSPSYHSQNVLSPINALWLGSYHGCVFIPVIKNVRYDIRCICSSITATFYPCQGNV